MTQNTSKGGQNPPNTITYRPAPPQGSGGSETGSTLSRIEALEKKVEEDYQSISRLIGLMERMNNTIGELTSIVNTLTK